jgi:hypothetical protein
MWASHYLVQKFNGSKVQRQSRKNLELLNLDRLNELFLIYIRLHRHFSGFFFGHSQDEAGGFFEKE